MLLRKPALRPVLIALLATALVGAGQAPLAPKPPVAERKPVKTVRHGVTLVDDYAWLRTAKPEAVLTRPELLEAPIRRHLEAEDRYATSMLAANKALEQRLVAEMRGRTSVNDDTVPEQSGPFEYYSRYDKGAQRKVHCRRPRGGGPEEVILDENKLAQGRRDYSVDETSVSDDHKRIAYSFDADGSERNTIKVRDIATGRDLPDTIPDVRGGFVWSTDGQWLFYVRRDPTKWARTVLRHKLGTPVAQDVLVYEEKQEGFGVGVSETLSDRYMIIETGDFSTTQLALLDLAAPTSTPRMITERKAGVKYAAADLGDRMIIATNADGAVNWKIGERPVAAGPEVPLREIVAHRPGRVIESIVIYKDHMARVERDQEQGGQQIVIRRWADGAEHTIAFGDGPAKVDILVGDEQATRTLRFTHETMAQPRQTFDYDMETRERTLRKVRDVPSGHDPARYVTRRVDAVAKDGERVPVSLLYRKDIPLDGTAPVWLYGYGAYGDTEQPEFVPARLSLVDRGFIYAIAHVRGGGDKGEAWHDAGRLLNKKTTFTDFIAVAEKLIADGLTSKGRIVPYGASAGGTLVGAAVNLRPDLFGAAIAEVPFVDVLNTMLDRSLPLTESGFSEFGNPIDNKADFDNMLAYSPYENVRAQAYPPMLIEQSLNDSRVPYWEAAKWAARLRYMKTDSNAVILWMKMRGGHSGGSGRFDGQEDVAKVYAYALRAMGRAD